MKWTALSLTMSMVTNECMIFLMMYCCHAVCVHAIGWVHTTDDCITRGIPRCRGDSDTARS